MMNREDQIQEEMAALNAERELLRSKKMLTCHCGKRSQISKWILIQDHHYIRPYSCSGGDYWVPSDEYHVVCPKCNTAGRIYHHSHPKHESENEAYHFVNSHAKYFGERLDSYDEGCDLELLRKKAKNKKSIY